MSLTDLFRWCETAICINEIATRVPSSRNIAQFLGQPGVDKYVARCALQYIRYTFCCNYKIKKKVIGLNSK
jgi:hypothetical protein